MERTADDRRLEGDSTAVAQSAGAAGGAGSADPPGALAFYAGQSRLTDPGPYAPLLDALPRDVPALCRVVRGLILHPGTAHLYGVRVPQARLGEQDTRRVDAILARILELDGAPLETPRTPERRFAGCCRDFAVLLCALLRHQGVPARARAGVARYFFPHFGVDHWVCEYWRPGRGGAGGAWVLVDAELDGVHRRAYGIAFDPHHVPRDAFLVAGEAWRRCRAGEADSQAFGVAPRSPVRGWRYLQSQLVRDVACLNKVELLCWDVWGLAHATEEPTDPAALGLLDALAALTRAAGGDVGRLRHLYESEARLRVPPVVTCLSAASGWRTPREVTLWPA
jgi:Transglutaminase-like superfamily